VGTRTTQISGLFSNDHLWNITCAESLTEWAFGIRGLGFDVEYNGRNGKDTTILRYGVTYHHSLAMLFDKMSWMRWRYLPIETFERGQQTSIAYRLGFTSRLFLIGFSDYNFDRDGNPN